VLLAPPHGEQVAAQLAERIVDDLSAPYIIDGQRVTISASVGVAVRDGSVASPADLVRRADAVMYLAKERGKDRYEIYDPVEHDALVDGASGVARDEDDRRLAS
jgi:GGDEF domain-containing protein